MSPTHTPVDIERLAPITHAEAMTLAVEENRRLVELVRSFDAADWSKPTDCTEWDVRALVAHVLGAMELTTSVRELVHQLRAGKKAAAGQRPDIDGMTEVQVRERASLTTDEVVTRLAAAAPAGARGRSRLPAPMRRAPIKTEVAGTPETWRLGWLFDVILTRDTWMHRVDLSRATGRDLVLTADHDGRLVADVVAEWARRHGRPFTLTLGGPAGGTFTAQGGGEELSLDAVEFCRTLSGRAVGAGLLTQEVPF